MAHTNPDNKPEETEEEFFARESKNSFKALPFLKPLASLKLTVVLLALSVLLVFFGTLAQRHLGIWEAVDQYFRCWFAKVEFKIFFPNSEKMTGWFPFPGGFILGGLMLINLLVAHSITFKIRIKNGKRLILGSIFLIIGLALTWMVYQGMFTPEVAATTDEAYTRILYRFLRSFAPALALMVACLFLYGKRGGVILLHGGMILLLLSELITTISHREGTILIPEGGSANFIDDSLAYELVLVDRSSEGEFDKVLTIPQKRLVEGDILKDPALPFDVKTIKLMRNSDYPEPKFVQMGASKYGVDAGLGVRQFGKEITQEDGVTMGARNTPAMVLQFLNKEDGKSLGTYFFSMYWYARAFNLQIPDQYQELKVGETNFDMQMRNKREYLVSKDSSKPFTIKLLDFRFDKYIGTRTPSNFSSLIRLEDPEKDVNRLINIWMNNPLRYADRNFFQQAYTPDEKGTILQVVSNDGWMLPYICFMIIGLGMTIHFSQTMYSFIRKEMK